MLIASSSSVALGAGPALTAVKREAAVAFSFPDLFPEGSSDLPLDRRGRFLVGGLRPPCCATPEIVSKYPGFKSSYHLFHRNSVTGVQQLMVEHRFRGFLGVSGNLGI